MTVCWALAMLIPVAVAVALSLRNPDAYPTVAPLTLPTPTDRTWGGLS